MTFGPIDGANGHSYHLEMNDVEGLRRKRRELAREVEELTERIRREEEQQKVASLLPEQRRRLWRVIQGGAVGVAVAAVVGAVREKPVGMIAIASMTALLTWSSPQDNGVGPQPSNGVIADRPGDPVELPPPPGEPPDPPLDPDDEDQDEPEPEASPDVLADEQPLAAEDVVVIVDDEAPEDTAPNGTDEDGPPPEPSPTPTPEPSPPPDDEDPSPSPSPTPTPEPTPSPSPSPTPTPSPTVPPPPPDPPPNGDDIPAECRIYVEVPRVLELCLLERR